MLFLKHFQTRKRLLAGPLLLASWFWLPPLGAQPSGNHGATVQKWAEGLSAPHGLALDAAGNVLVIENKSGRVLRFGRDGKQNGVVVQDLKAPSFAFTAGSVVYVGERSGNTIAQIAREGTVSRLQGEVVDPLGLATDAEGKLLVVSHRQSTVQRFTKANGVLSLQARPWVIGAAGAKYGWRDLAVAPNGTLYITDELSGAVLRQTPNGTLEPWVTGLSSPSGLTIGPRGDVYVTEEGNGRLSRLTPDGKAVVVAEGLGQARDALFLNAQTLLVSDRAGGVVYKVVLRP